jgi:hypothetical protein
MLLAALAWQLGDIIAAIASIANAAAAMRHCHCIIAALLHGAAPTLASTSHYMPHALTIKQQQPFTPAALPAATTAALIMAYVYAYPARPSPGWPFTFNPEHWDYQCVLCNGAWYTEGHVTSKKHLNRLAAPMHYITADSVHTAHMQERAVMAQWRARTAQFGQVHGPFPHLTDLSMWGPGAPLPVEDAPPGPPPGMPPSNQRLPPGFHGGPLLPPGPPAAPAAAGNPTSSGWGSNTAAAAAVAAAAAQAQAAQAQAAQAADTPAAAAGNSTSSGWESNTAAAAAAAAAAAQAQAAQAAQAAHAAAGDHSTRPPWADQAGAEPAAAAAAERPGADTSGGGTSTAPTAPVDDRLDRILALLHNLEIRIEALEHQWWQWSP